MFVIWADWGRPDRMAEPTRMSVAGWAAAWAYGVRTVLAEHPELVITAVRAIANAAPGCVVFHCAGGKDRTGLLALVLLTLAGATPEEIIADYLLTYDRMKQRYDELGARDQLTAVGEILASHNTTIEASLTSTIGSLTMPDFLLENGLFDDELAALRSRLTT